jgi:uncharacterized membrane protein
MVRLTPRASGPDRQRRPVDQHPLAQRARLAHTPDAVECAVDGQHQRQRGGHQQEQAQRTQAARLARKLGQRAQHRLGNAIGHQVVQEVLLQRRFETGEHREGTEHGQHHRDQRNQGDERGEGQAACRLAQAVFAEALAQRAQGLEPGPGAQRLQQAGQALARSVHLCGYRAGRVVHAGYDASMTSVQSPSHPPDAMVRATQAAALSLLAGLVLLHLARELWLAPTGRGTLLVLTVPPLLLCVRGMRLHRMITFRGLSLLVWPYVALAALRATTETGLPRLLATLELLLCGLLFTACVLYIRRRQHNAAALPAAVPAAPATRP